jgi:anti-sigma regulatory factor (Ser/Thr protein kinase)
VRDKPQCTIKFRATESAVPASRLYVAQALEAWGLDALKDDAVLVVDELMSNAIRYGDDVVILECSITEEGLFRIEVWDSCADLPVLGIAEDLDVDGRGLVLVAAYSTAWGAHPVGGGGKVVWAALDPSYYKVQIKN